VGKGTLIRCLRERVPGLALSVSATTRSPRPGEVDGRDYHFLTQEEFERRVQEGEFLEHASYAGNRYGTLRSELDRAEEPGTHGLVLEIEVQGARQVRQQVPEALGVLILPPSEEDLRSRLEGRGSDSAAQIESRLKVAQEELGAREEFRHRVVNDEIDRAAGELEGLIATMWGRPEEEPSP